MTEQQIGKSIILATNVVAAIAAVLAALYWMRASRTDLPMTDPSTGQTTGPFNMDQLRREMITAAKLNKVAAAWSALAALLGGISLLLTSLSS